MFREAVSETNNSKLPKKKSAEKAAAASKTSVGIRRKGFDICDDTADVGFLAGF